MSTQKDFDQGYAEAIEAIKQALSGNGGGGGSTGDGGGLPDGAKPVPVQNPSQQSSQGSNGSNGNDDKGTGQQSGRDSQSGDENVGDARNEQQNIQDPSLIAGGIIDEKTADAIAEHEGYKKNGQSVDAAARSAEDIVKKNIGKAPGALQKRLEQIFYTNTDWKGLLKKIIGKSLNSKEFRSAYVNKNVLVSRGDLARTNKDKFDVVDYIICCIDTSGSMTVDGLRSVLSEVYTLALKKKPINIVIIQFDTRVQDVQIFRNNKEFQKAIKSFVLKGGGGTDLKDCWNLLTGKNLGRYSAVLGDQASAFKQLIAKPCDLLMVFTDGYLDQQARDPKKMRNLCWAIIDNPGWKVEGRSDTHTMVVHLDKSTIN